MKIKFRLHEISLGPFAFSSTPFNAEVWYICGPKGLISAYNYRQRLKKL